MPLIVPRHGEAGLRPADDPVQGIASVLPVEQNDVPPPDLLRWNDHHPVPEMLQKRDSTFAIFSQSFV